MASNYGLGQIVTHSLGLSDLADVTVGSIKKHANDKKTFTLQYKHPSNSFNLVKTDIPVHEHSHDPVSLSNLDDVDETVAEVKSGVSTAPFGFRFNQLTNHFSAYKINTNLHDILDEELDVGDSIVSNVPYGIYYKSTTKKYHLLDLRSSLKPTHLLLEIVIHLKISPLMAVTKNNNIIKRIINSGHLYLSYNATDNCRLQYDASLDYLGVFSVSGELILHTVSQQMHDKIKTQNTGTMIIECIVYNTDGREVRLVDDIRYRADMMMHAFIIIHIQNRQHFIDVEVRAENPEFLIITENKRGDKLNIEKIYISNMLLIDVKFLSKSLSASEIDYLTAHKYL